MNILDLNTLRSQIMPSDFGRVAVLYGGKSAEREVSLVESALSALLRRPDAPSRARASELAPELAARLDEVRTMFVRDALDRMLS